ncbi:uncharacterized protein LOC126655420 [Mercurialis annua]|uniref:uncharacterized protein LOC126655420 n=1 Tax=Mercurialis annua TaxID=3986 RepID=UPI00216033FD|nr:uncharacterized protein LOC126655420 [Mercurialis annua]
MGVFGGRYYWGKKEEKREGIVLVFAWMSSQEKYVNNYVKLYASQGWDSLVCHSQFLNMFFSEKAETLAFDILNEVIKELKRRPCPLVFSSFSGGPKACMYKVLQIVEGTCDLQLNLDDCRLVKDCIAGHIFDSSPVDFTSDIGTKFVMDPSIVKMSRPPKMLSWMANGISNSLDLVFLNRFETQRAEYWQTLYSSVSMGAPYLIVGSESDKIATYQVLCNFAQRLRELGADVKLVTMHGSPHVGHFRLYPADYKAAVSELLGKASAVYSQRIQKLEGERMSIEGTHDDISDPMRDLRRAAASPNQSFRGVTIQPSDHFYMPTSVGYYEGRDGSSFQDEQKEGLIHLPSPPKINAHGVLGQILFDVCVPKNVEDWDMRPSTSLSGQGYSSTRRHAPFNPIKCIRRSRL